MDKVAFLFPGQGSQSIGMLAELARQSPLVKTTFDEASQVLGYDLWAVSQQGPEERLNQTEVTQPAMLAAGVACWRVWKELGGFDPHYMAGHSLGEYTALVASGALEYGPAIVLVTQRARDMQAATPAGTGAMAAILGLEDHALAQICAQASQGQVVECANFNSPGQVVIAGAKEAVQRACALAMENGARKAIPLAVSVPSHCALMRRAAQAFEIVLSDTDFRPGGIPVLHNVDVQAHSSPESIRAALVQQLYKGVRWTETIRELESRGVDRFAECGPGRVLVGLNRRITRRGDVAELTSVESMRDAIAGWSH